MKRSEDIGSLRRRIDVLNRAILGLLNQRMRVARRIGAIKRKRGIRIADPVREKAILRSLVRENRGPLDKKAVLSVFQAVIRQTRRLEKELQ